MIIIYICCLFIHTYANLASSINDWEQHKLGQIAERVTRKNKTLESTLPLTISAQDGLVDQRQFFDKVVASKNVSNYYLIKKGEFAYNKSYSNGYPWGTIKRLDNYHAGVLSTLYILFRPTNISSDYLVHYYESSQWYREVSKNAAEGARNHGLLNISAKDFFDTRLLFPNDQVEQKKIAKLLNALNLTITLHQRKLVLLKQLKKGLLQKMFADNKQTKPVLRFKDFNSEWEQHKLGDVVKITMGQSPNGSSYHDKPIGEILVQGNADLKNGYVKPRIWTTQITKEANKGDIIMSVRAPAGEVGKTNYHVVIGRGVAAIKGNEFIYQLLSRMDTDSYWEKYSSGSTFEFKNHIQC